ncbi:hypothetical protein BDK51DRAFT_15828 [Blyttiomyces helicus]|uniref:Mitochondrial zinc maintenance protein 1, mitochondrial n=1 Tax=Blyttiomyces helicus TaxID=388810 RepID=A0A4P9WAF1_9FUNG|nr:hypothetical protein BDK51DRAFT_15828 [Blyttiomyces helicus]|eukprot:RKO87216.1 hypothetical protein BDK51DRAFT_15828 [Blyttiomyces helicus]
MTALPPALRAESLSLYRSYIRVWRAWPKQENRAQRLSDHIRDRLREDFRVAAASADDARARIDRGRVELDALRRIVDSEVDKKHGLPEASPILAFLPAKKTFTLLDTKTQEAMSQKKLGTTSYIAAYLSGQLGKK